MRAGRYDGSSFFRIVTLSNQSAERHRRIAVIQGGLRHEREDLEPVIPHESTATTGLRHLKGTVSLARFAPGAVYHSFFICLRDEPVLDFGGARHPDGQGFAGEDADKHSSCALSGPQTSYRRENLTPSQTLDEVGRQLRGNRQSDQPPVESSQVGSEIAEARVTKRPYQER